MFAHRIVNDTIPNDENNSYNRDKFGESDDKYATFLNFTYDNTWNEKKLLDDFDTFFLWEGGSQIPPTI